MSLRTFTDKNGNTWEWNETPEVIAAVKNLAEFAGNYPGPLYAPHPDITKARSNNTVSSTGSNDTVV